MKIRQNDISKFDIAIYRKFRYFWRRYDTIYRYRIDISIFSIYRYSTRWYSPVAVTEVKEGSVSSTGTRTVL